MSRERKTRRDQRRLANSSSLRSLVKSLARHEDRELLGLDDMVSYFEELKRRGVLVTAAGGAKTSVRFENLHADGQGIPIDALKDFFDVR